MGRNIGIRGNAPTPNFPILETRTTRENVASSQSLSLNVPISQTAVPVPYVAGRRRISQPNVLWYGNPDAIYEEETVYKKEVKTVLVGAYPRYVYRDEVTETWVTTLNVVGYNIDIMMGLCLGPDVRLREIYHDSKRIWSGNIGPARSVITLPGSNDDDTPFGGCQMIFHGGAFDQAPDPVMAEVDDMPGHVGLCYVIIRNVRADMDLGSIWFEVERFPNPLGLSNNNNRRADDINPKTAMVDLITNPWGGVGLPIEYITSGTFVTSANLLASEGNFASVLIETESSAYGILGVLQDQTESFIFQNPSTGKLESRLIRQVLNPTAQASFTGANLIDIQDFKKTSWAKTIETLRGVYVERDNNYEPTPVIVQNLSGIRDTKGRSSMVDYPYVTKGPIALNLVSRALAKYTAPVMTATLLVNRDGADLLPGSIVLVTRNDQQLYGLLMVVTKVRKSPIDQNTVLLTVAQYKFPEGAPIYDLPGPPYDPDIDFGPRAPSAVKFITAPFWLAEKKGLANVTMENNLAVPIVLPTPANPFQASFTAEITNSPGVGRATLIPRGINPTYGTLFAAINRGDGFTTGLLPNIVIDSVVNPTNLRNIGSSGVREGRLFVAIGDELLSFESCTEVAPRRWQLNNVRRALLDTVARSHSVGADVHIFNNNLSNMPSTPFTMPVGFTPNWRVIGNTVNQDGRLEDGLITNSWPPSVARSSRAPRPHHTAIEGVRSLDVKTLLVGPSYNITWRTRTRNALDVRFQSDAAETAEQFFPETEDDLFQYHRVYLRDNGGVLRLLGETDPTMGNVNSLSVTVPVAAAEGPGVLFVRSVIPLGESVIDDELPVTVFKGSAGVFNYQLET